MGGFRGGVQNLVGLVQPPCVDPDQDPENLFSSMWTPTQWRGPGLYLWVPEVGPSVGHGAGLSRFQAGIDWVKNRNFCVAFDNPGDPWAGIG